MAVGIDDAKCPICNAVLKQNFAVAHEHWPFWANAIAVFAAKVDIGIGDTFHRLAEKFGAEWVIKKLGINCGCQARREEWNQYFPYDNSQA